MDKKRQFFIKVFLVIIFLIIFIGTLAKFKIISFDNTNLPVAIMLNKTEVGIKLNDSYELKANIYPLNSFKGKIEWESSKPEVVEVVEDGKIYGRRAGDSVITAKIPYNNMKVECLVHVSMDDIPVESIILSTSEISLLVGDSYDINYQAYPLNSNTDGVYFVSSDNNTASVDNLGHIIANKTGIAYVKAYTLMGDSKTIKVNVLSKMSQDKISISSDKVFLNVGSKTKIKANKDNVYWESLNPNIASVHDGLIEALNVGSTKVLVKLSNENLEVIDVTVRDEKIELEDIYVKERTVELYVGDSYELNVKVTPINATNQDLEYLSEDLSIASIDNGVIEAHGVGTTGITIKNKNSYIQDVITVRVIDNPNKIELTDFNFNDEEITMYVGDSSLLEYKMEPVNATPVLNWTSSNSEVVMVDDGLVKALREGEATIYVNEGEISRRINIKVLDVPLLSITANETNVSLSKNETYNLKLGFIPNNASNIDVIYTTDNPDIAIIENGVIRAINVGNTIIRVKSNNIELNINVEVR